MFLDAKLIREGELRRDEGDFAVAIWNAICDMDEILRVALKS